MKAFIIRIWKESEWMQVLNLDEKNTERMDAINKFTLMDDTFMTQVFSSDLECTEELLKIISVYI